MSKSANAVLARVRAMYGNRLTGSDYSNLLSCSSFTEIANYLKTRTSYGDIFAPNSGTQITAESIEFSLNKEYSARLQKICAFERMINDKFYDYFILKSDIELILDAARTLVSTSSLASSYIPTEFFNKRSALDIKKLYNSNSASELISALEHTRYYPVAKKFISLDGLFDFSAVEILLAKFYAKTAKEMAKKYDKNCAKELAEIIDLEIDGLNIANIYRLKKLGVKNEIILAKLIFEHGTISKSKLLALLDSQGDVEFINILSKTKIGKNIAISDLIYPESVFEKNKYIINKRYLRFSSSPDIAVITYFNLLETEIKNVTHIIEGKRYNMSNEQITSFLVGIG